MSNVEIVQQAMIGLVDENDSKVLERYWHESYIQLNPSMNDDQEGIKNLLPMLDSTFKWRPEIMVEENNLVITQRRIHGGRLVPFIVIDIFKIENGKITDHWDVIKEETLN